MERPESIENAWDVLYRDYPDVYDEWERIAKRPTVVQVINRHFALRGMTVVDVGSGSGISTFATCPVRRFRHGHRA